LRSSAPRAASMPPGASWAVADGLADPLRPPICGEMVLPTSPPFIEPCLPGEQPPTGSDWVHEIKHEGYRLTARRDPAVIAPHELMVKLGRSLPSQYWAHPFLSDRGFRATCNSPAPLRPACEPATPYFRLPIFEHPTSQARLDEAERSRAGTRQHGRTEIGRRRHGRSYVRRNRGAFGTGRSRPGPRRYSCHRHSQSRVPRRKPVGSKPDQWPHL
jgi:hypothetical protein